jgi:hypothetical protein
MTGDDSVPVPEWPVAIVFAGGEPVAAALREWLPEGAGVIAADSGLHVADALGVHVDLLVGDLDSADRASSTAATRGNDGRAPSGREGRDRSRARVRRGACARRAADRARRRRW